MLLFEGGLEQVKTKDQAEFKQPPGNGPAAPIGALVPNSQGNAVGKVASAGSGEGTLILELVSPLPHPTV